MLCALAVLAVLLGSASAIQAQTVVTLAWDANTESDIGGYEVSYGTQAGVYSTIIDVGNVTSQPFTITSGPVYYFVVKAYNTSSPRQYSPYSLEVSTGVAINRPPTLTQPANQTSAEHASISLQLVASDLDLNPLTYGATGLPASLAINAATGLISGTLTYTSAGNYTVTATVSDGALTSSQTFTWTVTDVAKTTPVITWANPASIVYGTALSSIQLNATANVAGTFVYTPSAGTVVSKGTWTLAVAFTPTDAVNCTTATRTVTIVVTKAPVGKGPKSQTVSSTSLGTTEPTVSGDTVSSPTPIGLVESPAQDATGQVGAIGVTGWAVDGAGVLSVTIYRNCLAFEPAANCAVVNGVDVVLLGAATLVAGARPDVEAQYASYSPAGQVAWGYLLLTNLLPHIPTQQMVGGQGTVTLHVLAEDVDGHQRWLGRSFVTAPNETDQVPTTVTLANDTIAKPFGAIETAQAKPVSGSVWNIGWMLTPDHNTAAGAHDTLMPLTGSAQHVYIDGVAVGSLAASNQCQGTVGNPAPAGVYCDDAVASLFGNVTPQPTFTQRMSNPTRYRNLDAGRGAMAGYYLDTTTLGNGVHTIAWQITDSAGRSERIGSGYVTVVNGAGDAAALWAAPAQSRGEASTIETLTPAADAVWGRTGFDVASPFVQIAADAAGVRQAQIPERGRLELKLGPVAQGYLVANGTLRDLPPGSRLDPAAGTFTWAPGLGYLGTYRLAFVRDGEQLQIDVTIR